MEFLLPIVAVSVILVGAVLILPRVLNKNTPKKSGGGGINSSNGNQDLK